MYKLTNICSPERTPRRIDVKTSVFCEPRTIDSIIINQEKSPLGDTITYVSNDIDLFRNQQKILKYNPTVVQSVLAEFAASSTQYSDALKGISDEDILATVKSRYIQSTTDLVSYTKALERVARETIQSYVDEKLKALSPPIESGKVDSLNSD